MGSLLKNLIKLLLFELSRAIIFSHIRSDGRPESLKHVAGDWDDIYIGESYVA